MPACCRPWGEVEPACPPGPGRPLTGAQLQQALLRAAPDASLPDDLDEDLRARAWLRSPQEEDKQSSPPGRPQYARRLQFRDSAIGVLD